MERKFYPENFERFLKGHADQFKMTPSKKVWHGIYNDLHPGRRWPSIAMSMVFIFTLVIIGHLNTNNGNNTLHDLASLRNTNSIKSVQNKIAAKQIKRSRPKGILEDILAANNLNENISDNTNPPGSTQLLTVLKNTEPFSNTQTGLNLNIAETRSNNVTDVGVKNKMENPSYDKIENTVPTASHKDIVTKSSQDDLNKITADNDESMNKTSAAEEEIISPANDITTTANTSQANLAKISKPQKINNITWTYYLTSSISYRYLSDNNIDKSVIHYPMLGYEGGTALSFNIYKKLQFTTGLQLNYSGYNIQANNVHPMVASLILNNENSGQYEVYSAMSHYGNKMGTEFTKLKNYSLQASIPIGLQYAFAGNDNIKLSVAASFQPSFIISGKAYLLSEDKRNYLTNPELIRKLNINTNFTTYVSFSSASFNWQIGPQVRYQPLSTYTKRYQLKENLINYGIRVGISKISK